MKHIFIAISVSILSTVSFAEENLEVVPSKEAHQVIEDSSAFHRVGKQWMFGGQILGVGPAYSLQQGVRVGYFLDRNMLVEGEIMFGNQDGGSTWGGSSLFDFGRYEIDGQSIGVHLKHFVGNSFYYRAGLDYRWLDYEYTYDNSGFDAAAAFKGTSAAVTFNIGNQWHWKNFNLGCEWVGLSAPILSNISDKRFASNSAVYDINDFNDDQETLVKDLNLNLLRFYLGASF